MFIAVCLATSVILAIALWFSLRRVAKPGPRVGDRVDYGEVPGTRVFDAELEAVGPSKPREVVDKDASGN